MLLVHGGANVGTTHVDSPVGNTELLSKFLLHCGKGHRRFSRCLVEQ